ncbi:MAG TPA: ABC transporter ATP-binding protein [Dehalococcoidia bacterium]|nr:ABC transporter ATP-binding protein [Dehalococcoidia bacterium]
MQKPPAIELHDLVKDYGSVRALDGLSLSIEQGEIFGFLGPNGAGKTTTIRIIFDLIRPTSGSARILGTDCQSNSITARSKMGYLPGDLRLYDGLTGRETIDLFSTLRRTPPDMAYVRSLLERLDLDPHRVVREYSKGNRQKLGLVLALLHQPELIILDEPTGGLDPLVQEEVAALLFELAAQGRTVFFSSHILSEVEHLCHRVAFLRQGRLIAVEEVGEIKGRSLHIVEVTFDSPVPRDAFCIDGVREVQRDGDTVHLEVRSNLDAVLKAIARYHVVDMRTEQPNLEQVFRAYYEGGIQPGERMQDAAS